MVDLSSKVIYEVDGVGGDSPSIKRCGQNNGITTHKRTKFCQKFATEGEFM